MLQPVTALELAGAASHSLRFSADADRSTLAVAIVPDIGAERRVRTVRHQGFVAGVNSEMIEHVVARIQSADVSGRGETVSVGGMTRYARRALLASMVAVLWITGILASPLASAAPKCSDIEVVFARGTDEPAGIGVVGQALVDTLRPMVKGKSVGTYAVRYPATWDFLQVAAGANDTSKHIQSTVAKCPDTKIVLGGYSQGAAVMDVVTTSPIAGLGYTSPLPAAVIPHVAAVAVFGNPSARLGRPLTTLSPDFGPRTADLCNTNDPICSLGRDFNAHVRYEESGLVKVAAQWVTKHVQDRD
jgi:cutinase